MNWPKLKRRIRLQPNLIDPYRKISYREARRIWKEQGRPDVLELLEGARKKSGRTPEEWLTLTGLKVKNAHVTHSAALRRWAVACVFVLLFSAFLAFTAPGRAFAAQVYRTVVTIIENYIKISTPDTPDINIEPQAGLQTVQANVHSISEAYEQVNGDLFYFPDNKYVLKSITVTNDMARGQSVSTEYAIGQTEIYLVQRWPLDRQKKDFTIKLDNGIYYSAYGPNNLLFEGVYTEHDRMYTGAVVQSSYTLTLIIEHIDHIEDVDTIIYDLTVYDG